MASPGQPWFAVRKELSENRSRFLTFLSFLAPLLTWALVSYTPFFWHPDIKLKISADRDDVTTVYTAGDHLSKDFFPTFQEGVRQQNQRVLEAREREESMGTSRGNRRANIKTLRHLAPHAIENQWLSRTEAEEDAELFQLWLELGSNPEFLNNSGLTPENQNIAAENAGILLQYNSGPYDYMLLPDIRLQTLVPQGVSANPVYLPAPHEVLVAGYRIFTRPPEGDNPSMGDRLLHSLRIVFGGFVISCFIGVPLGILCGTYTAVSRLFEPFIDFFRYMPAPAFSTLLVAIFMAHDAPKIALVFVGTFFQMVLVVANTTRQLDIGLLEAAQTLGANRFQLLFRVTVPGILPNLYNDLRILLGWSWTWLVIAELIGVKSGLTEFIETQGRWRNFDLVYPVIITIGIIGFSTDQFLARMRPILFPYLNHENRVSSLGRLTRWLTADRLPS